MKTEIVKLHEQAPQTEAASNEYDAKGQKEAGIETPESVFERAGKIINDGGLVAFPTETVYGLGGNALDLRAAEKIYAAKGRPSDNPLIVHISDISQLVNIAEDIPSYAEILAERFWPGPMTLILKKKDCIPSATTGGLDTVAVRLPSHPAARALIDAAGVPVAAPSANLSGRPSPTTAEHVASDLSGRVDMIIDGGPCEIGLESTIIDCTAEKPVILRPGYVLPEQVFEICGSVGLDQIITAETAEEAEVSGKPKAPGMKYRHYSPLAPLKLFTGERADVIKRIVALAKEKMSEGKKVGILCCNETYAAYVLGLNDKTDVIQETYEEPGFIVRSFGSASEPEHTASKLFSLLREMDELKADVIFAETVPEDGLGLSVMNRMKKAAGFDIEQVKAPAEPKKSKTLFADVIFVDRSNTTHSVICESIFNFLCKDVAFSCVSRGVSVLFPEPVNKKAVDILADHGLRPARRESKLLERMDISEGTLILALGADTKGKILKTYPSSNFVYTLDEFTGSEELPVMTAGDKVSYEKLYQALLRLVTKAYRLIIFEDSRKEAKNV